MSVPDRPGWQDRSACVGMTDLFYSYAESDIAKAVLICRRCPVQAECRAHALHNQESSGVWGGVNMADRGHRHWFQDPKAKRCTMCGNRIPPNQPHMVDRYSTWCHDCSIGG